MSSSSLGDRPSRADPGAHRRRWFRAWGPALLWATFVFVMSSVPGPKLPPLEVPNLDKIVHAAVYGVLGMLCWRGVRLTRDLGPLRAMFVATGIATLYGISDEFHQAFTPNRAPDWNDVLADAAGSFLGALVCALVARSRAAGITESRSEK